jgi:hypothetical protein
MADGLPSFRTIATRVPVVADAAPAVPSRRPAVSLARRAARQPAPARVGAGRRPLRSIPPGAGTAVAAVLRAE